MSFFNISIATTSVLNQSEVGMSVNEMSVATYFAKSQVTIPKLVTISIFL